MVSIPERIIEVLETESKLTIKEIFKRLNEPNNILEYVRICIYRLLKSKSPKIVKDGKKGKEYLYSLEKNAINPLQSFSQYNELFKKLTQQTEITKENLMKLAKETLDFNKIKELEKRLNNNGILG